MIGATVIHAAQQACGTDTATDAFSADTSYSTGQSYGSEIAACRAAQQGLRDKLMNAEDIECGPCADPFQCFGIILCNTDDCDELTVGPAVETPPNSNMYKCTAEYKGDYGIRCTTCVI